MTNKRKLTKLTQCRSLNSSLGPMTYLKGEKSRTSPVSSSGSKDDQLLSTAASDVASKEGEVTGDAGRSLREDNFYSGDRKEETMVL